MHANTQAPAKLSKAKQQEMVHQFWTATFQYKMAEAYPMLEESPWLMRARAPKSIIHHDGQPFLHAAFLMHRPELAAYGIAHAAPLEDRCPLGNNALAALFNVIRNFSEEGRDVKHYSGLIEPLLEAGARCNSISNDGTPVWLHAKYQPLSLWKKLVKQGDPLNFMQSNEESSLSLLCGELEGKEKIMHLVRCGADVNLMSRAHLDDAPLIQAYNSYGEELADILLSHGADIHVKDTLGRGFLHFTLKEGLVKWFIDHGVDVNGQDVTGKTPLLYALHAITEKDFLNVNGGVERSAMAMIIAGADLDARDHQDTSMSCRELIKSYKKLMPALNNMLLAFEARQVAMQSLSEMGLSTPSP